MIEQIELLGQFIIGLLLTYALCKFLIELMDIFWKEDKNDNTIVDNSHM